MNPGAIVGQVTVEAAAVRVGDRIWNSSAPHPAFRWARVTGTAVAPDDPNTVVITTDTFETRKHAREGVALVRPDPAPEPS